MEIAYIAHVEILGMMLTEHAFRRQRLHKIAHRLL
jgi:hypothetical protein